MVIVKTRKGKIETNQSRTWIVGLTTAGSSLGGTPSRRSGSDSDRLEAMFSAVETNVIKSALTL